MGYGNEKPDIGPSRRYLHKLGKTLFAPKHDSESGVERVPEAMTSV